MLVTKSFKRRLFKVYIDNDIYKEGGSAGGRVCRARLAGRQEVPVGSCDPGGLGQPTIGLGADGP